MNKLQTLYNILGINQKLPNAHLRLLYLKDIWGIEQNDIAACESCSQSYISKTLIQARKLISHQDILNTTMLEFSADEIRYIQFLPREIINDVEVVAFLNNILNVDVFHPFFMHFDYHENLRIAALARLGIQNKLLQKLFNKTQPGISMIIKRNMERIETLERNNRYDDFPSYKLMQKKRKNNFILAGGQ